MLCRKCGNQLPDDAWFCNRCGERQHAVTQQQAGQSHPHLRTANSKAIAGIPLGLFATGYSLGGYLAADVRLGQPERVLECITFNAPGRAMFNATGQIFGGKDTRITNYYAIGDNVHNVGTQPGNVKSISIAANAEDWPVFGKHDIQYIIDAFIDIFRGAP